MSSFPYLHVVYGVRVVAASGDEAIVGRDVLNQLRLVLDGPAEVVGVGE